MKKKTPVKKTPKKKAIKTIQKKGKKGPKPYKKCIDLVVQMAEEFADFGDCPDQMLDDIADLKKQLDNRQQAVVGYLVSGICNYRVIEIDEASPGSELAFKI